MVFSQLEVDLIRDFTAKINAWKTTKNANISKDDRAFIASLYDMPNRDTPKGHSARKQKAFILKVDDQSPPKPFAIQFEDASYKHVLDVPSDDLAMFEPQLLSIKRNLGRSLNALRMN